MNPIEPLVKLQPTDHFKEGMSEMRERLNPFLPSRNYPFIFHLPYLTSPLIHILITESKFNDGKRANTHCPERWGSAERKTEEEGSFSIVSKLSVNILKRRETRWTFRLLNVSLWYPVRIELFLMFSLNSLNLALIF